MSKEEFVDGIYEWIFINAEVLNIQKHHIIGREERAFLSYSKWAARECARYIESSNKCPDDAMDEFVKLMDNLACGKTKHKEMFSIAYDVCIDIYDYLMRKGENSNG